MKPLEKTIAACLLFGIVAIWFAYPHVLLWLFSPSATLVKLGPFGDLYGGLNTLFSGLALFGLGVNIYMQGVQIKKLEAREDDAEAIMKQQVEVMKNTALLQYYNEMISQIEQQIFELEHQHQTEEKRLRNGSLSGIPSELNLVNAAVVIDREREVRELSQIDARLRSRKAELDKQKDRRRAILAKLNAED